MSTTSTIPALWLARL